MPRNQLIVKFPTLNDKRGDLSKKWYVEYFYRIPGETVPRKRRISEGLCTGSHAERYANAERIIAEITRQLKSPDLFQMRPDEVTKVLRDDVHTRPEADRYAAYENRIKAENLTAEFTEYMCDAVSQKTHETYRSKLHIFADWCKANNVSITTGDRQALLPFFQYLARERNLTKRSIFKYKQILHSFFDWQIRQGLCVSNPVTEIPNYGKIADCAPAPIDANDIQRLKETIRKNDPCLWLACCIQYYCAIRPGTELRLLKVGDINMGKMEIRIAPENAKNRSKAIVPMPEEIAQMIQELGYMNYPKEFYLFGRYNIPASKPMGKNTLRNRFNQYRDDLKISKQIKFYSWKHTGAISMVENGVSVWELQHHMRHSSITTTEEYIRQRASQAKRAKDYLDRI